MTARVTALVERRATVYAASAASLLLGLFFIFVWTPLPWAWKGIDGYDTFALALADGQPFSTIHVAWGYAYFLAIFYRLFGNHPAIPLAVQALFNASIPVMLYHLVRVEMNERIAVMAALLTGVCSFNTVYVSTQAPDPMCTVIVVAAMLCFACGERTRRVLYFAGAGVLAGVSYQFRPNLALLPAFMAGLYVASRRPTPRATRLRQMGVFLAAFVATASPWVIRNYRWTGGLFVPATTHGGVQLWFGTLQTGPYRESWLYNPRAAFEFPPVEYTSIDELPIIVTAVASNCGLDVRPRIDLVYWTNRDQTPRHLPVTPGPEGRITLEVPRQPPSTAIYYYFDITSTAAGHTLHTLTPPAGPADPFSIVVSRDHLGDLDLDGHMLDVFDVARMLRHLAWMEPLGDAARLDLDGDGRITDADVRRAAALIVDDRTGPTRAPDPTAAVTHDDGTATLAFKDGSTVAVPRGWSGRITDLQLHTTIVATSGAARLVSHSRSFAGLANTSPPGACLAISDVAANRVPYRRLPHEMRRFMVLSLDNIRYDPGGFLLASALRALRVFIVVGSEDPRTASQFAGGWRVYTIARIASLLLLVLFGLGVWIAWRRGFRLLLLLGPVLYLPLTICFMLINARYSMTMQPFVFAFAAVALVTALESPRDRDRPIAVQSR